MSDPRLASAGGLSDVEAFTLASLLAMLRRRILFVVVPLVLFSAGGVALALYLPEVFSPYALVALEVPSSPASSYNPTMTATGQLPMVREIVNRRSFLEPVITDFDLYETKDGQVAERRLDEMRSRVGILVEGPYSFRFAFEDTDPERATAVVARIADRFIQLTEATQQSRAQDRVTRMEAEVATVEAELLEHQRRVEEYKDNLGGDEIPENLQILLSSMNSETNQLQQVNRSIVNVEAERAEIEEERRLLESLGYDGPEPNPAVKSAEHLALERQLAAARDRYTDQHPEVLRLEAELANLANDTINGGSATSNSALLGPGNLQYRYIQLKASLERIDTQLEFFQSERDELIARIDEYQQQIDAIPQHEQELSLLMRDYEIARTRYFDRIDRLEEAQLDARLSPSGGPIGFHIAQRARVPEMKSGPPRRRIALMGALIGLFVGCALLLAREQLDSTFPDLDQLRDFSKLPTLAATPFIRGRFLSRDRPVPVPTLADEVSVASEQYRILASRLQNVIDRECAQVLLVTSSAGAEGKTTTAVNIALGLSQIQPEKVLLIDADLRKPGIRHCLSQVGNGRLGPVNGIVQLLKSPDALKPESVGRVDDLYVLASGERSEESLHDLTSASLRKAFARLRKEYKYIIIDSPPLLPMVDSHILANVADRVVLVVRADHTRRETLSRTLSSIDQAKVLGFVLNGVNYSRTRYRSAYDYYAREYVRPTKPKTAARIRIL